MAIITVSMSADEKAKIKKAARAQSISTAAYMRQAGLRRAEREVAEVK